MELQHKRSLSPSHTSLMLACQQEIKEDVRAILERQPAAALQRDRSGKNALHYCAENATAECAGRVLSAAPALLHAADAEGYTPLHLAVISGNRTLVRFLLAKGADAAAADSEKHSCVHWATVSGDAECVDLLIGAGADPSTPDMHGAYPVHYAAQMCGPNSEMGSDVQAGLRVLRKLLERKVDVACVDRDGRTPLLWAASGETRASKTYCPSGSSDAILALVKAGANVNAVDKDGLTALHCAASRGHIDCLETLLTLCGAEVDKCDDSGCSALFYAVTLGHADCAKLLLTYGSNCNRQDNKGRSPAHCGAAKGQMETLKILSQHKANLWMRNAKGDMPLHEAVQSGRKDLVEWLLEQHQGSVNVSNSNGRTPLHIAAITNNVDMCKVLMDYGAFINPIMRNSKGQHLTPLDAALHRGNRSCAKYLSLHGALPASKLLEKKEYNRFTEAHLSEPLDVSPGTKRRLLRDTSAQTEPAPRLPREEVRVEQRSVGASADLPSGGAKGLRCATDGKPIIAKVYVHTKRSKLRRALRKPTGHRRDCQGQKLLSEHNQRRGVSFQRPDNGTSDNLADTEPSRQTYREGDPPSRKQSRPSLFEATPLPTDLEEQPLTYEDPNQSSAHEELRSEPPIYEELLPSSAVYEDPLQSSADPLQASVNEDPSEPSQPSQDEEPPQQPSFNEEPPEEPTIEPPDEEEPQPEDSPEEGKTPSPERDEIGTAPPPTCDCYDSHEADASTCDCSCHLRSQLLSVQQRRRSSLRTNNDYDLENHSPLSSIRSLESTIKDSGFSDDVDRGIHQLTSSDDERGHSDSDSRYVKKRSRRHIARYIVSSGAAETFRLEEDDEEDEEKVTKPRSSSLPHLRKREEHPETTCPRLLNRPTLTKEVQKSLKKYQMERRLFYELQELKRKQITTSELDERDVVQKMLQRFRNHVLSPFMTDFQGPLTFRAFERYLYEQLRKLSMCGKIPKPKFSTKDLSERMYIAPVSRRSSYHPSRVLCTCESQKCPHNKRHNSDFSIASYDTSDIPTLPKIRPHLQSTNRSKSWDRLDEADRCKSTAYSPSPASTKLINSQSLPSLANPFPRRVPAALLAAISERLGPDVHPDDTIVVEMSSGDNKMRHAFTVHELKEVVSRYEEQVGRKVRPIPLETVLDPDDDGPITFEIRHGKERSVFKLPAGKLKDNKKWQVIFTIGKGGQKGLTSLHAK